MKLRLGGGARPSMFGGRGAAQLAALEHRLERIETRLADLERRLEKSEAGFKMSVRFFEHRVDQIYARILPVLGRETALFAGPDEPVTGAASDSVSDWHVEGATGFLEPGRYGVPLADSGFRIAVGAAVERGGAVEVLAGRTGAAVFGPYKRLVPGSYRFTWHLAPAEPVPDGATVALGFDLYCPDTDRVVAQTGFAGALGAPRAVEVSAAIAPASRDAVFELRVHQLGGAAARLEAIEIRQA